MPLVFADGRPFACGAAHYEDRPVTLQETTPRIVVHVRLENFETSAFVDTGGVYLLCSSEVVHQLQLDPQGGMFAPRLNFRGSLLSGSLHRIALTLLAEQGNSVEMEAIAFVPDGEWTPGFPCILGLSGCLEFMRFAIDPTDNMFYFGGIDSDS